MCTIKRYLDSIMIYYLTNSITTTVRLYAEELRAEYFAMNLNRVPIKVLTLCVRFKNDIMHQID